MSIRLLVNGGKGFEHNFFPSEIAFIIGHVNVLDRVLPKKWWNQISRSRDLLDFRRDYRLGQPNEQSDVDKHVNNRRSMQHVYYEHIQIILFTVHMRQVRVLCLLGRVLIATYVCLVHHELLVLSLRIANH